MPTGMVRTVEDLENLGYLSRTQSTSDKRRRGNS
jgi:DNA-binding MarR family transcriptional regulator